MTFINLSEVPTNTPIPPEIASIICQIKGLTPDYTFIRARYRAAPGKSDEDYVIAYIRNPETDEAPPCIEWKTFSVSQLNRELQS
jgi:hypothetical protein